MAASRVVRTPGAAARASGLRHRSGWPTNTWGEADRHDGWRSSNWAGNVRWGGRGAVEEPRSEAELADLIRRTQHVRVVGSAHSFTPLVVPGGGGGGGVVSLRRLPAVCALDEAGASLVVDGGATLSEIAAYLHSRGLALATTASLPHFSIAGALATGTHGSSGVRGGRASSSGLAACVRSVEILGPGGDAVRYARGGPGFEAAVVSLGLLGVVTRVELDVVPGYDVFQRVYGAWPPDPSGPPLEALLGGLPAAMADCDSFSAFVDWSSDAFGMLVLREKRAPGSPPPRASPAFRGAPLLAEPIDTFIEGGAFETTGVGPWTDKMHVWMRGAEPFGPQGPAELQFEHFVPLKDAADALDRTRAVAAAWGGALLYSELRAVRGDGQLLSPYTASAADGHDSLAICNGLDAAIGEARVLAAAAALEDALAPLNAKFHWGKLTAATPADVRARYGGRLDRFTDIARAADPKGKFSNAWADRMLGLER